MTICFVVRALHTHTHTHFLSMQWFALISFEVAFHQDQPFLCSCVWLVSLQTRVSIILTGMLYVFDCKNSPIVFLFLKILCIRIGKIKNIYESRICCKPDVQRIALKFECVSRRLSLSFKFYCSFSFSP